MSATRTAHGGICEQAFGFSHSGRGKVGGDEVCAATEEIFGERATSTTNLQNPLASNVSEMPLCHHVPGAVVMVLFPLGDIFMPLVVSVNIRFQC